MRGSGMIAAAWGAAFAALLLFFLPRAIGAAAVFGAQATVAYGADSSTLLFDDFENATLAKTLSAGVSFDTGYLSGKGLRLGDTAAHATYSDSWWRPDDEGRQDSGTIECYVKVDAFIFDSVQFFYPLILTQEQHPIVLPTTGIPEFGFLEENPYFAVGKTFAAYDEFQSDTPLNPGQWYHMAATWGPAGGNLYVNGRLVRSGAVDTNVIADTFHLGAPLFADPSKRGLSVVGVLDRFRLSTGQRSSFPRPLEVVIDTPVPATDGETKTLPMTILYRASADETRARTVDLYLDTDLLGFDGILLASALGESGSVSLGYNIPAGNYYLLAVAHAGDDRAYTKNERFLSLSGAATTISVTTSVDPANTTAVVPQPITDTTSFLQIALNGGDTTPASQLATDSNSTGTGADYSITIPLLSSADSVTVHIWTTQRSGILYAAVRSDTASLLASGLPVGIPASDAGKQAIGATAILLEFANESGQLLGTTSTTASISDTYVYSLVYTLSETTANRYRALDITNLFRFAVTDTYGGVWTTTEYPVSVEAGSNGGLVIRVTGMTTDLPGGLGGIPTGFRFLANGSICLVSRAAPALTRFLEGARDLLFEIPLFRLLAWTYYRFV